MDTNIRNVARYLILTDTLPQGGVDAVFLFTRARYDEDGLFETIRDLQNRNLVKHVVTNSSQGERLGGNIPGEIWPGIQVWLPQLKALGIERVHLSRPAFHTRDEAEAFLETAKKQRWASAAILTQPHQLMRATLSVLKVMQERNFWMKIYSVYPANCDWFREVYGPQGRELLPRYLQIEPEESRIDAYIAKDDIATPDDYISYRRRREQLK